MKKTLLLAMLPSAILLSTASYAISYGEPITTTIDIAKQNQGLKTSAKKEIVLMNIKLSDKQKRKMLTFFPKKYTFSKSSNLPSKIDLGMNNVPVLDQGRHGSCVTFASTGAINALLHKGDYISQLCSLELGSYLEQHGYLNSGWNGSQGAIVLDRIREYGIVSKEKQRTVSCAGVKEYPVDSRGTGNAMSVEEFKLLSEDINEQIYADQMLTFFQRFQWDDAGQQADKTATAVKEALAVMPDERTDVRVTFAAWLPVNHGSVGASAKYHETNDTWALTDDIINDPNPRMGGHEMIITGYDDNAVVTDNTGKQHQGVFILRNSWGEEAGDHGTYYMTYDFFKQFVMYAHRILGEKPLN